MTGQLPTIRQRYIGGGRGAVLTLMDQMVSSASSFIVGVLIARAGGADALGAFGIAFLIWLAAVGANRALVTEPMTVGGSSESDDARLREGMLATLVLGLGVAGILAVAGGLLMLADVNAVAVLGLAPWIPSLLVHDYWRAMAFRVQRADRALISDIVFALIQGSVTFALFALDVDSVSAFLASWGIGASAGALTSLRLARIRLTVQGGFAHLHTLWPRSRWFLAEFSTAFLSDQGYLLLLPLLLGTAALGEYRAGFSLIGPVVTIFLVAGNVGLPECVRQLRHDGMRGLATYTPRLTAVVVVPTILYCGVVAVLAEPILLHVYGEEFVDAAVITQLVAIQYVLFAVGFGYGVALKAAGEMRQLWVVRMTSAVLAVTGVIVLANVFGLTGAGVASVVVGGMYSVGVIIAYRRMATRDAGAPGRKSRSWRQRHAGKNRAAHS